MFFSESFPWNDSMISLFLFNFVAMSKNNIYSRRLEVTRFLLTNLSAWGRNVAPDPMVYGEINSVLRVHQFARPIMS
ncbi:unnamed protein product [Linum trigynum]|uniref:Uncharacterized protein n=1 Tax=Linum trigynum TaxID=586398 RepID=A0AAV2G0S9_9ROSI